MFFRVIALFELLFHKALCAMDLSPKTYIPGSMILFYHSKVCFCYCILQYTFYPIKIRVWHFHFFCKKKQIPNSYPGSASVNYFYFSIRRDSPVISAGFSIPISSIRVGIISARQPPSFRVYFGSAFTRINGTGFVV